MVVSNSSISVAINRRDFKFSGFAYNVPYYFLLPFIMRLGDIFIYSRLHTTINLNVKWLTRNEDHLNDY